MNLCMLLPDDMHGRGRAGRKKPPVPRGPLTYPELKKYRKYFRMGAVVSISKWRDPNWMLDYWSLRCWSETGPYSFNIETKWPSEKVCANLWAGFQYVSKPVWWPLDAK